MLYLILAKDGTDPGAPERRQKVRDEHLRRVLPHVEAGRVRLGGALLDGERMIGSALVVEAETEAEARALVEGDIYTESGVWQSYEIYPFRRAVGAEL